MAKSSTSYSCTSCGYKSVKALGRCPNCMEWGTLEEEVVIKKTASSGAVVGTKAKLHKLSEAVQLVDIRTSSGLGELDRVLGGGFVAGEVVLLGGEPGVGKSTILLQVSRAMLQQQQRVIYLAGEESVNQIALRAERLGVPSALELLRETSLPAILATLEHERPDFLVVDSVQTIETESSAGSISAVREATARLTQFAKDHNITMVLVGHVTKEGQVAGPKVIEHVVDCTLYLETAGNFRVVRSAKNRFGQVGELGVFAMEQQGLVEVTNPSAAFLAERPLGVAGSVVALALSGERSLALEVQALAAKTPFPAPKRVAQGIDARRMDVILAVLERRLGLPLGGLDIYVNLAGGIKIVDAGLDLAIALAVYSSVIGKPLPEDLAVVGEVGLAGELRRVEGLERRIKEGSRSNFSRIVSPNDFSTLQAVCNKYL